MCTSNYQWHSVQENSHMEGELRVGEEKGWELTLARYRAINAAACNLIPPTNTHTHTHTKPQSHVRIYTHTVAWTQIDTHPPTTYKPSTPSSRCTARFRGEHLVRAWQRKAPARTKEQSSAAKDELQDAGQASGFNHIAWACRRGAPTAHLYSSALSSSSEGDESGYSSRLSYCKSVPSWSRSNSNS